MSVRYASGLILALCCIACSRQSDKTPPADGSPQSASSADTASSTSMAGAVRRINSILDDIAERDKRLPHREFDPAALATALGTDPKTQYEWVRDHTWWVPYAGLLRGARGVLLDRVGSTVDRAVLLGDLLRRAGHQVRLAHTTLSQLQASDLLTGMKPSRPQRPGTNAPAENSAPILSEALALVDARADPLLAAFEDGAAAGRSRSDSSAIEAIRDHWWVEYLADGKWIALDLLAPAADMGHALAAASDSYVWEPASEKPPVPDEQWHSVNLRVVVERYENSATTESTVLEHVLRPAEVLGMRIELTHYPTPWPEEFPFSGSRPNALGDAVVQVRQWVPMLFVGDRIVDQSGIADDGSVIADPFSSLKAVAETGGKGIMGGFDEALGGGAAPQSFMTAEWLDFEIHVPGSAGRTIRRPIFDVLGPEKRAARVADFDAGTNDLLVKRYQALVGMYSILIQPCAFTEDYVSHLAMGTFLEVRGDVQRLAVEKDPKVLQRIASSIVARMEVWNPLSRLAHMRSLLSNEAADWFIDQPNVLILGKGLPVVNADKAALIEFIDIASNSVGVRPDPALNAFQIRLRQGVVDTIAEQVALTGTLDKGENTATTFPLDAADAWQLINPRDLTAARKLDWPDDVVARLAEDLDAGYAAYVPGQAFDNGGRARWGWWRIDPSSGETVGVMDTGLRVALTEKKAADMTSDEKKAYWAENQTRWTKAKRAFGNKSRILDVNDLQMMKNMLQIKKELAAGLLG
jgi:hypothetical protein